MAFVPFASCNSRSITHLANYLSQSLPMNSSDDSIFKEGTYNRELNESAAKQLSELATALANTNVKVRTEVGTANDVGMELVRIAEHDNVDMIVIATHGMTGWRRIAFGSVARKVVEQAVCPVLVLRAKVADHSAEPQNHSSPTSATAG